MLLLRWIERPGSLAAEQASRNRPEAELTWAQAARRSADGRLARIALQIGGTGVVAGRKMGANSVLFPGLVDLQRKLIRVERAWRSRDRNRGPGVRRGAIQFG